MTSRLRSDHVEPRQEANDQGPLKPSTVEKLEALATRHFAASNEPKRPQWYRKAHAHAFAGVLQAANLVKADPLLRAAPEMLQALLDIRSWILETGQVADDGISHPAFVKANNAANEAIAKASGQ